MTEELYDKVDKIKNCPFCKSEETYCKEAKNNQKQTKRNTEAIKTVFKMKCDDCNRIFKIVQEYEN